MTRPVLQLVWTWACAATLGACSSAGGPELTSGLPPQAGQAVQAPGAAQIPAATLAADAAGPEAGSGLPTLPSLATFTGAKLPVGSPTEVYTRIARGALTCWFGASGPLKGPYIYHAEAEPPSKGGRAEIVVRTRDLTAADPRSLKAFRVAIAAGGEGTQVDIENAKIPEPLATRLTGDVRRWASDTEGCGEGPITAGWTAAQDQPAVKDATGKAGKKPADKKSGASAVP